MEDKIKEFINNVISKWNQENCPELYTPYREGNCVLVYGDCTGVVIYPYDNYLGYTFLGEDDGFYYIEKHNPDKAVFWIKDDIKCLEIAMKYLEEHATPLYYVGCEDNPKCQCGWQLPFKD